MRWKSRKFLVALGAFVATIVSDVTGYPLAQETVIGLIGVVAAYLGVEGVVDRQAVKGKYEAAKDEALQSLRAYARELEDALSELSDGVGE